MLRLLDSLSSSHLRVLRKVLSPQWSSKYSAQRAFCSAAPQSVEQPVLLFKSPAGIVNLYRLIGLSVYSQVVASCIYVEQMLFPSTPSKYSFGVQLAFASGLVSMSCTIPMVYFFAIRRNIFQVSILKSERALVLSHLGRGLRLVESKVKLDDIEPLTKLNKNLRLMINRRETNTLDTLYLERRGKYLDRELLEKVARGQLSQPSQAPMSAATATSPAPTKYAIRPKKVIKDAPSSAPSEEKQTTQL